MSAHAGTWTASTDNPTPIVTLSAPQFALTGTNINQGGGDAGVNFLYSYTWHPGFAGDESPTMIAEHDYNHDASYVIASVSPLSNDAYAESVTQPTCILKSEQSFDVDNYSAPGRATAYPGKNMDSASFNAITRRAQIIIGANQDGVEIKASMGIQYDGNGYSDVSAHVESHGLTLSSTAFRFFRPF